MLIDLRKTGNERFHRLGHIKRSFWEEVAGQINQRFRSNFSSQQCSQKFNDVLKDCRVNILYYILLLYDYPWVSIKLIFLLGDR